MSSSLPERFETDRLLVRAYAAGDGPMYYDIARRNREHLRRYESGNILMTLRTEEEAERAVQELARYWSERQCYFMGAFEREGGAFAAQVYVGKFKSDPPEYIVGYIADRDHEGQGYVTEAVCGALRFLFDHLDAHRVRIHCDEANDRSRRVAERCGFVREGCLREDTRGPEGLLTGTVIYGLLRREFEERNECPRTT